MKADDIPQHVADFLSRLTFLYAFNTKQPGGLPPQHPKSTQHHESAESFAQMVYRHLTDDRLHKFDIAIKDNGETMVGFYASILTVEEAADLVDAAYRAGVASVQQAVAA